jgi:hypothetical protein
MTSAMAERDEVEKVLYEGFNWSIVCGGALGSIDKLQRYLLLQMNFFFIDISLMDMVKNLYILQGARGSRKFSIDVPFVWFLGVKSAP